jgi:hypothetical protein
VSQLDVAREALAQIGTRSTIASLDDGTPEARYISLLYMPLRDFLLVDGDWAFSLATVVPVEVLLPPYPWVVGYEYPAAALRVRQLVGSHAPFDPRPIEWNVVDVGGVRVIYSSGAAERIVCTVGADEALWDAMFRQSFVRMLASALAFALENRIEASKVKLDEALGFAGIAKLRDM